MSEYEKTKEDFLAKAKTLNEQGDYAEAELYGFKVVFWSFISVFRPSLYTITSLSFIFLIYETGQNNLAKILL